MKDQNKTLSVEFMKYTLVGLGSTVIQYGVYSLCYYLTASYYLGNIMGFLTSVWNSYFWNRRFVFHSAETTVWWRVLLKSYSVYFGTGVIATNLLSWLFIGRLGMSPYVAPILIVLILYPINYLVNKRWAHRKDTEYGSDPV